MIQRCNNPNHPDYMNYGGRGITVCQEWEDDFKKFFDWSLSRWKRGLTIDRRENDEDYGPKNCRYVTRKEQNRNTRRNVTDYEKMTRICLWDKKEKPLESFPSDDHAADGRSYFCSKDCRRKYEAMGRKRRKDESTG